MNALVFTRWRANGSGMSRARVLMAVVLILAAVLAAALYPTEKKRIRKVVSGCRAALEQKDLDGLMDHLSYMFRGENGMGYLELKKRAEMMFRRYDEFDVTADVMNITVDGDRAEADLKVTVSVMLGKEPVHLAGDAVGPEDIRLFLEKSTVAWKITGAERMDRERY